MFYKPEDGHGLPHSPFYAIVTPRPIGWISTRGNHGDNLAPYSFFNAVASDPPQVVFASNGIKDSLTNIRATGVFAVNIVSEALMQAMNQTSANLPLGTDEFTHAGLARSECKTITCPFVTASPAVLECRMTQIIELDGNDNHLILGAVTGIHIADDCLVGGRLDVTRFHPVARLGYKDYTVVRDVMTLDRPR
jgi:flavin reductase (DIM6/NTAB) family NADH-FMN oxidoreductase RutF